MPKKAKIWRQLEENSEIYINIGYAHDQEGAEERHGIKSIPQICAR